MTSFSSPTVRTCRFARSVQRLLTAVCTYRFTHSLLTDRLPACLERELQNVSNCLDPIRGLLQNIAMIGSCKGYYNNHHHYHVYKDLLTIINYAIYTSLPCLLFPSPFRSHHILTDNCRQLCMIPQYQRITVDTCE